MFIHAEPDFVHTPHPADGVTEEMADDAVRRICTVDDLPTDISSDPLEQVGKEQLKTILIRLVEQLPEDDRLIITLYYYEELTFREIGIILRLSESRISQKHASVMRKLRCQLGGA